MSRLSGKGLFAFVDVDIIIMSMQNKVPFLR